MHIFSTTFAAIADVANEASRPMGGYAGAALMGYEGMPSEEGSMVRSGMGSAVLMVAHREQKLAYHKCDLITTTIIASISIIISYYVPQVEYPSDIIDRRGVRLGLAVAVSPVTCAHRSEEHRRKHPIGSMLYEETVAFVGPACGCAMVRRRHCGPSTPCELTYVRSLLTPWHDAIRDRTSEVHQSCKSVALVEKRMNSMPLR